MHAIAGAAAAATTARAAAVSDALLHVMRRVPSSVAVVSCRGAELRALTIGSFAVVTLLPVPLVSVCIVDSCRFHYQLTHPRCRGFAVNLVPASAEGSALVRHFARPGLALDEHMRGVALEHRRVVAAGGTLQAHQAQAQPPAGDGGDAVPVLARADCAIVCRFERLVSAGDHTVVFGRVADVLGLGAQPGAAFSDGGAAVWLNRRLHSLDVSAPPLDG